MIWLEMFHSQALSGCENKLGCFAISHSDSCNKYYILIYELIPVKAKAL